MLNELQIKDMVEKADLMKEAIENDDRDALEDALGIPCDFCWDYKKKSAPDNDCCDDCPLWEVKACHHSPIIITDFRVVDRYYAHFRVQSQDPKAKEEAIRSARRLHDVIVAYGKEGAIC